MLIVEKDKQFYSSLEMIKDCLIAAKDGTVTIDYMIKGVKNTIEMRYEMNKQTETKGLCADYAKEMIKITEQSIDRIFSEWETKEYDKLIVGILKSAEQGRNEISYMCDSVIYTKVKHSLTKRGYTISGERSSSPSESSFVISW